MFLRKTAKILATGVLALSVLSTAAFAEARKIRLGTVAPSSSAWAEATHEFARLVNERSEGRFDVQVFNDSQLGSEKELFTAMKLGTVDMNYTTVCILSLFAGADVLKVTFAPYLFDNAESALEVMNSDFFNEIYEDVANDTGIRVFSVSGVRSPRAIQTTKGPINGPEDLKGLKLRVPGVDIFERTFQVLGVQTVPLPAGEIYTSLSRGVVDGQDNGFDYSVPNKFHEVAKYWSATDHVYTSVGWMMSQKLWGSITEADRELLFQAGQEAGLIMTEAALKADKEAIETLKAAGVEISYPDVAAFRAAFDASGLYDEFEGVAWPEGTVAKIRELQSQ